MTADDFRTEQRGGVLVCTFDRADGINLATPEVLPRWIAALRDAADDPSITAIVTAGSAQAWCAGADVDHLLEHRTRSPYQAGALQQVARDLYTGRARDRTTALEPTLIDNLGLNALAVFLRELDKPLIAAIDGAVAGGGFSLAMMHDIRLVTPGTTFRTSFLQVGLVSEIGLAFQLARSLGHARAADVFLSGRPIDGVEAAAVGLAQVVVDDARVTDRAVAYAQSISTLPARSVADLLRLLRLAQDRSFEDYVEEEWATQRAAFDRDETLTLLHSLKDSLSNRRTRSADRIE